MSYRIKDWSKFQHFKDRRPPWIKLYRDILDDIEWHELDPAAAKTLVMVWLMASEDDGRIPDLKKLAFRLRQPENKTKEQLSKLSHWLEQEDINPISGRYQYDAPERETEKRQREETEEEREAPRKRDSTPAKPDGVTDQVWSDWLKLRKAKRASVSETVIAGAMAEANKARMSLDEFLAIWCLRGSQGLQADWIKPSERRSPPSSDDRNGAAMQLLGFAADEDVIEG